MQKLVTRAALVTQCTDRKACNFKWSLQVFQFINTILNVRLITEASILLTIGLYLKSQQMQQFSNYRAKRSRAIANVPTDFRLWRYSCHITSAVQKLGIQPQLMIKFPLQSMGEVNHPLKCLFSASLAIDGGYFISLASTLLLGD